MIRLLALIAAGAIGYRIAKSFVDDVPSGFDPVPAPPKNTKRSRPAAGHPRKGSPSADR